MSDETAALTVAAPEGAHFEFEEVKTARGATSLGDVPLLIWDDLDAAVATYGISGVMDVLDGTSLRVSFQNIARRYKTAGKSNDEIAQAQIAFRPGKRPTGTTPKSRATKAVSAASEKVGGDTVAKLLDAIASGSLSAEQLAALGISLS